jgi:putative transposase
MNNECEKSHSDEVMVVAKNYSLAVGGHKDHVHIFFELNPTISVSDVLKNVKSKSSKWINTKGFVAGKFEWQSGYGAFTYSRSQRNDVIKYIALITNLSTQKSL